MTVQTYCFVCGGELSGRSVERHELAVPDGGGQWVFVYHTECASKLDMTIPLRFHDMALRALGHPRIGGKIV